MCKNITDALFEDAIEITWMFDALMRDEEIKPWDSLIEEFCGSDGIKQEIRMIAAEFEMEYPYTMWEDSDKDYLLEIGNFAKEKLLEVFGYEEDSEKFNPDDYTIEFCPWCETEQFIYSTGITACPNCGKPLAPCSMCKDCVDPCPYGCTGGEEDEDKPIDHYITQEEIDWNREWERNHSK